MAHLQTKAVEYPVEREFEQAAARESVDKPTQPGSLEHLLVVWRSRQFIFRAALLGLLTGTLVAFLLPKRYTSVVQLMPPDGQSNSGMAMLAALSGKSPMLSGVAGDLLGVNGSGALFVKILQSRTIQDRLVRRFDLKRVYRDRLEEDANKDLAERTGIADDLKSGVITISVTDGDAHRATAVAQAYVDELNTLSAELSTSAARRERIFLEERLKAVKLDLDHAALEFSQFASKNTAVDIKEQARAMVDAAARLQGELIAAESQQKGLEAIYASTNPRVLAVQARVAELRRQLEKIGGAQVENGSQPNGELYPSIRELPILGVTYADLYRRTRIQEAVYETLTQQYELAKVQEAKETPAVKILDPPSSPERRSFPPRSNIMFLCMSFGLAVGVFWVILRHRWAQVSPTDARKRVAEEIFHSVQEHMPWAPPNGSRTQALAHRVWIRYAGQNGAPKHGGDVEGREPAE